MGIQAMTTLSVQIPTGPSVSVAWTVKADAYDRASVTVAHGQTGKLQLQPGAAPNVLLMVLTSTDYSGNVTYKLNGTAMAIKGPQIVAGSGLVNSLPAPPQTITFDNTAGAADVTLDVLVLRTALV
jgi:hypothetical protein